jgi:hypothetical protein
MSKSSNKKVGEKIASETESKLSDQAAYGQSDSVQNSDALGRYTSTGYAGMNAYLRGTMTKEKAESLQFPPKLSDIKKIDSVISDAPTLPEGITLYRGIGERGVSTMMNMQPGDTCNDKAFQSFSTSPFIASSFDSGKAGEGGKRDKVMIRAITSGKEKGLVIGGSEHEVLMPRGQGWKVVSNNAIKENRLTTVHVITVVPT